MDGEIIYDSSDDEESPAVVVEQHTVPAENNSSSSSSSSSSCSSSSGTSQALSLTVEGQQNIAKEATETKLRLPNELVPMDVVEQNSAANSFLVATGSRFFPKFAVDDLVDVKHRPRKGKDKEGGRARIEGVHPVSIEDPSLGFQYDVKFVVFRKREYRIDEYDILPIDERREADRSRHTLGRCK